MSLIGSNAYTYLDGIPAARDFNGDGLPDLDTNGRKIFADPATETIIDATGLLLAPINTNGVIEVRAAPDSSLGTVHFIQNLTLRGNHTPRAGIIAQAARNSSLRVTLASCVVERLPRGIQVDVRRAPTNADNSRLDATITGNVFRDNSLSQTVFGHAIQSSIAQVRNHRMHLSVRNNLLYGNKTNLSVQSFGDAQDSQEVVESENNIYEESKLVDVPSRDDEFSGGIIVELRGIMPDVKSIGNLTEFNSRNDKIWNNEGSGLLVGFVRLAETAEIAGNTIKIELKDTLFVKLKADGTFDGPQNRETMIADPSATKRRDIKIVALAGVNASPELTSGNRIDFEIKGATSSLMPTTYDPAPEPLQILDNFPQGVEITIDGSPKDFSNENTGFNVPDESLFD